MKKDRRTNRLCGVASDWSVRYALPRRRSDVAAYPKTKVRPQLGLGFIEPGEFVLEKIRFKDFWNAKCFFLRDRAAFLVGVSKHGSRMGHEKAHCSRSSNKTKPLWMPPPISAQVSLEYQSRKSKRPTGCLADKCYRGSRLD